MLSLSFQAAGCSEPYAHYIKVGNRTIRRESTGTFFMDLASDGPTAKTLRIAHVDSPSVYNASPNEILLMTQVTESFDKTKHNPVRFHLIALYSHKKSFLNNLPFVCLSKVKNDFQSLRCIS